MEPLRLRLMHREAVRRLSDADMLHRADPLGLCRYDSDVLLRLLALELLLKFLFEDERGESSKRFCHEYWDLYQALSEETQQQIVRLCVERIGPSSFSESQKLYFRRWSKNFVALRYPFQEYDGLSEADYATKAARWLEKGCPIESAAFVFYPMELLGVLYALQSIANERARTRFGAQFVHDLID